MLQRTLASAFLAWTVVSVCVPTARAQVPPPAITGAMYDGAQNDICASQQRVWIAAGRNVAVLDAVTGQRLGVDTYSPYASSVQAIEYDPLSGVRAVATVRALSVIFPSGQRREWQAPAGESFPTFQDIKLWPGTNKIFAIAGRKLVVFDYASTGIVRLGETDCPTPDVGGLRRLHVQDVDGDLRAYIVAGLVGGTAPRKTALLFADLDREHGYVAPSFQAADWRAHVFYANPFAGARAVEVMPNLVGTQDVAFVADNYGELTLLDVSDPAQPVFLSQIHPSGSCGSSGAAYNLLGERARDRLYVAGANRIYTLQLSDLSVIGCADVEFVDAGRRDMALVRRRNGARLLWTTTPHAATWSLNGIDVSALQPSIARQGWWIASSDGGVAAPQWHSIYLPTFGGVVRYELQQEWNPQPVDASYRPSGFVTEHIEIAYPDPSDASHAVLLTAPANGGVQVWPVSAAQPNPGAPVMWQGRPSSWNASDPVYQNDIEPFTRAGRTWALSDLTNNNTGELALLAFDIATGEMKSAVLPVGVLVPNTTDVAVAGNFALVGAGRGVFIVRIDGLPNALALSGTQLIDLDQDGQGDNIAAIASNTAGDLVFVATDSPGAVGSFTFDRTNGTLSGPLSVLHGAGYPGCVGRIRYFAPTARLYVASRSATLLEILSSPSGQLQLLSTWRDEGCYSDLQDAHVYDFGHGPRVLAVKNTEGFVLLNPVDGL